MDCEYLFECALLALGPPLLRPRLTRDGVPTPRNTFNDHVRAYNEFAAENWEAGKLYEVSYVAWSDWFYEKTNRV